MGVGELGLGPLHYFTLPRPPQSGSRRLQQRYRRKFLTTAATNRVLLSLNTLSTSFSSSSKPSYNFHLPDPVRDRLAMEVDRATRSLQGRLPETRLSDLLDFDYIFNPDPYPLPRQASSIDDSPPSSSQDPSRSFPFFRSDGYFSYDSSRQAAVPLVSDLVALPDSPPTAQLLDLLPSEWAKFYNAPSRVLRKSPDSPPQRPFVGVSEVEYRKLLERMRKAELVDFTTEPASVCGIFAVPKGEQQRLIIDARPTNRLFSEPPRVSLPTPDILAALNIKDGLPIFGAKCDLSNFYHSLLLPPWMRKYFCLPPVLAEDLGLEGVYGRGVWVYPMCKSLPMGASHAVFLAQTIHEHLVSQLPEFAEAHQIREGCSLTIDSFSYLLYIDDLVLLGPDEKVLKGALEAYLSKISIEKLLYNPKKLVWPTLDGFEVLGLSLDGTTHELRLQPAKLQLLIEDTHSVLRRGYASGLELSRLVGRWSWIAMLFRPAFAVFSAVYHFITKARSTYFTLWRSVKLELAVMAGISPLLVASLGASFSERVIATDASSKGFGVVSAVIDPDHAVDMALYESVHESQDKDAPIDPRVNDMSFKLCFKGRWRTVEHINVLELRALTLGLRWFLSLSGSIRRRVLFFTDSQVVQGCVGKGRSSSRDLLLRLRWLSALLLASSVRLSVSHIRSEYNPADEPSRH